MVPARAAASLATCLSVQLACQPAGGETGEPASTAASTTDAGTTGMTSTGAPTTGAPTPSPFSVAVLDRAWITGTGGWDTQHADVAFDLGDAPFSRVTLVVDLDSDCFPFEKWSDNPPPQDQVWPASCDAFDRTMGFIVDPAGEGDPPGFELLRSITPFGGPAHLEVDVTDWANAHPGAHVLRSYINSWPDGEGKVSGSAGGWHLSARFDVAPGPAPRPVLAALSLFQGDYTIETPDVSLPFTLPEGTASVALEYTISGHGGAVDPTGDCIGPAEEFCKRMHHVYVDGAPLAEFPAWRNDCAEYCTLTENTAPMGPGSFCLENPCGAIGSVQAARANWCPGAQVSPLRGPVTGAGAAPGDHALSFVIDDVVAGGVWTVSATLYAYGD